jgi:hypothetical protein
MLSRAPISTYSVQIAILCFGDLVEVLGNDLIGLVDLGGLEKSSESSIFQLLQKSVSKDKKFVVDASKTVLHICARWLDSEQMLAIVLPYTKHKCEHSLLMQHGTHALRPRCFSDGNQMSSCPLHVC